VYDVTEDNSLTAISEWIEFVKKMGGDINVPGVLIANKTDLTDLRVVTPKAGMDLANTHGLHYLETSVVSNHRPLAQNNNASTQFIGNNCSICSLFFFFFLFRKTAKASRSPFSTWQTSGTSSISRRQTDSKRTWSIDDQTKTSTNFKTNDKKCTLVR
jgi:hypothetical protein